MSALALALTFSLLASLAQASPTTQTWYVDAAVPASGDGLSALTAFKSVGEATARAQGGDTILVAAGTYTEPVILPISVTLLGAGAQQTIINGAGADNVILLQQGGVISGFTLMGSGSGYWDAGVWIVDGGATVAHNRITGNSKGIVADGCGEITCPVASQVLYNIIDRNLTQGIFAAPRNPVIVRNNTVVSNTRFGVVVEAADSVIENNIVVLHEAQSLTATDDATVIQNVVYNYSQYETPALTRGTDVVDPLFWDIEHGDYRLLAGSPLLDASVFVSPVGALAFTPVGVPPLDLRLTAVNSYEWQLEWMLPISETSGPVAGVNLYLRVEANNRVQRIDAGDRNSLRLRNLLGALTYTVAASTYNAQLQESALSPAATLIVPPLAAGLYQESSPALRFVGAWQSQSPPAPANGQQIASDTPGDLLEFAINSSSFVLTRTLSPSGGRMRVWIDEHLVDNLDFYFPVTRTQTPAVFDQLGEGVHHVRLEIHSESNKNSVGRWAAIDALRVPNPYSATTAQVSAAQQVNHFRLLAGIPPVQMYGALNLAAQAHSTYALKTNTGNAHQEISGTVGFTGEWPNNRAAFWGYGYYVGENLHSIGDPTRAISGFIDSVYHRNLIMDYLMQDVGYGLATQGNGAVDTLMLGGRLARAVLPQKRLIYSYPAANQSDVPTLWTGGEVPDPLPGVARPVGYPIGIYFIQPDVLSATGGDTNQWQLSKAELLNTDGTVIDSYVRDNSNDKNLPVDMVYLIPKQPLTAGQTFTMRIQGIDSRGTAFDHQFSFVTHTDNTSPTQVYLPNIAR